MREDRKTSAGFPGVQRTRAQTQYRSSRGEVKKTFNNYNSGIFSKNNKMNPEDRGEQVSGSKKFIQKHTAFA